MKGLGSQIPSSVRFYLCSTCDKVTSRYSFSWILAGETQRYLILCPAGSGPSDNAGGNGKSRRRGEELGVGSERAAAALVTTTHPKRGDAELHNTLLPSWPRSSRLLSRTPNPQTSSPVFTHLHTQLVSFHAFAPAGSQGPLLHCICLNTLLSKAGIASSATNGLQPLFAHIP